MAVPKTTMNEDNFLDFREDEVGFAGKAGNVKSETLSACAGDSPYQEFRFSPLTPDERHSLATLSSCESVHCPATQRMLSYATVSPQLPAGIKVHLNGRRKQEKFSLFHRP